MTDYFDESYDTLWDILTLYYNLCLSNKVIKTIIHLDMLLWLIRSHMTYQIISHSKITHWYDSTDDDIVCPLFVHYLSVIHYLSILRETLKLQFYAAVADKTISLEMYVSSQAWLASLCGN